METNMGGVSAISDGLERDAAEYSRSDTIDSLREGQLQLLATTQCDLFVYCMRSNMPAFDADRIRLLLEMGAVEAQRRLCALRSNVRVHGPPA